MRYTWKALYNDGTSLGQINEDGSKNAYSDIDRTKLSGFELWDGNVRVLYLSLTKGQRLIWRRRSEMVQGGVVGEVCHIVGKQETIDGKNIQGIIAIFESDGHIEIAERFNDKHPWLYPIPVHYHEGEVWLTE